MSITLEILEHRIDSLKTTLIASESTHEDLKERSKIIKKEISNIKGAIIEIERLIDNCN